MAMADRRKCPECGVSVKVENLPAHYAKQHPRAKVPQKLMAESTEVARAARKEHRPARPVTITTGGKRVILVVAVILAVILIVIIVNPFRPPGPQVGDTAPGFSIPSADPQSPGVLTLSSYRGSVTVLELMDVDCSVCQQEAPILSAVYRNYSSRGVRFLSVSLVDWVSPADTPQTVETFKTTHGTTWPYGMDYNRDVRNAYFPGSVGFGTPTTYILDPNGVIRAKFQGSVPGGANGYANALDAVLRG